MTFEHIPPRAAGNNSTVRSVPYDVWHEYGSIREFPQRGWTQAQRGAGAYVLCKRCNSVTGRRWVNEYVRLADTSLYALGSTGLWREPPLGVFPQLTLGLRDVYPGRFVRQVLTMLLAVSGGPNTAGRNPAVTPMVLEGRVGLPDELRIFMNLYAGPGIRLLPVMGALNLHSGTHEIAVEVGFPPFSFIGVLDERPRDDHGLEITDWCEITPEEEAEVRLELPVCYGRTPFIGDYRSAAQVEHEAAA